MGPSSQRRQIRTSMPMDSGDPQKHDKPMESQGKFERAPRLCNCKVANTARITTNEFENTKFKANAGPGLQTRPPEWQHSSNIAYGIRQQLFFVKQH
jgi:hypothetical protein